VLQTFIKVVGACGQKWSQVISVSRLMLPCSVQHCAPHLPPLLMKFNMTRLISYDRPELHLQLKFMQQYINSIQHCGVHKSQLCHSSFQAVRFISWTVKAGSTAMNEDWLKMQAKQAHYAIHQLVSWKGLNIPPNTLQVISRMRFLQVTWPNQAVQYYSVKALKEARLIDWVRFNVPPNTL